MELFSARKLCASAVLLSVAAANALNYDVQYAPIAPVIDGEVTDTAWTQASPAATGFVKHDAVTQPSGEQTQVQLLWDSSYLYVSYQAADLNVVSGATGNDAFTFNGADVAHLLFDPGWRQHTTMASKFYRIAVDPSPSTYTYTEAGLGELDWNLSSASSFARSSSPSGWTIEGRIAWSDFNSTGTNSAGIVPFAPQHNSVWGAQFGRHHSMDVVPNNAEMGKWHPTAGDFQVRVLGTITFKGGPVATKVNISTGTVVFQTGLESDVYTNGATVVGKQGFVSGTPGNFLASTEQVHSGSQALRIGASSTPPTLAQQQAHAITSSTQYAQYALRLPMQQAATGSYRHVLYIFGLTDTNTTGQLGQIWFRNNIADGSNTMSVISYEDPLNETASTGTSFAGIQGYDTWNYVTVRVDPETKKFNVWLNDKQLTMANGSKDFGWRSRSTLRQLAVVQFYAKNYGSAPVYVDDLTFVVDSLDSDVSDWQLY